MPPCASLTDDDRVTDQQMYVAVLLFRSTSPAARYEPLHREDLVLLRATSLPEARVAAERHGRAAETSYENGFGERITDRLLQVVDVAPVLSEVTSLPADLYSRHFRDLAAYRRFDPLLDGEPLA